MKYNYFASSRIRTYDLTVNSRSLCQLSYRSKNRTLTCNVLIPLAGVEPAISGLEDRRLIHLATEANKLKKINK